MGKELTSAQNVRNGMSSMQRMLVSIEFFTEVYNILFQCFV